MKAHFTHILIAVFALAFVPLSGHAKPQSKKAVLNIVRSIPHSGYSEGLVYHKGFLWNAVKKSLNKIDPKDGTIVEAHPPATSYSESLVWIDGFLWNVSFADNGVYKGRFKKGKLVFERKGTVPEKHAWGLTYDGKHLIMTGNYSSYLYFYDLKTVKQVRKIKVNVVDLEDLAWDGKGIWTSSFTTYRGQIFRVDPKTGRRTQFFSLPDPEACPIIDGIAFHKGHLYITGKHCPKIWIAKKPSEKLLALQAK